MRVRGGVCQNDDSSWELRLRGSPESPWRTILSVAAEDALNTQLIGFAADDRHLYLLSSEGANTSRLVRLDTVTGERDVLFEDPDFDVGECLLHPRLRHPQLLGIVRERKEYSVLDQEVAVDMRRLQGLGNGELSIVSRDLADQRWVVCVSPDDGSSEFHLYDRVTGHARLLFASQPELRGYAFSHMEPFSFAARDGLRVHGYLTYPPDLERRHLPTVVLVHGGPWDRHTWGFHSHAQFLANRGYLVVQVNFRGSTGYGKSFVNAGDREWAGRMQDDLVDAVRLLVDRGHADPARLAIWGGSYGGYAALVGAAFTPDLFACAVAERAPVNLKTLLESVPAHWKEIIPMLHRRVGNPATEADFLWSRSPLSRVDQIKIPLLLAFGAQDPRVTRDEADQLVVALERAGVDYQCTIFEDEGHGLSRPEHRLKFYAQGERFLARHLGGREEVSS